MQYDAIPNDAIFRVHDLCNIPAREKRPAGDSKRASLARTAHRGVLNIAPSTLWRWIDQGRFPSPQKFGPNCTGWTGRQVREFLKAHFGEAA